MKYRIQDSNMFLGQQHVFRTVTHYDPSYFVKIVKIWQILQGVCKFVITNVYIGIVLIKVMGFYDVQL